jgi:O-antigen ligase/polysaccharide polymerase Wzy-like membrane protein
LTSIYETTYGSADSLRSVRTPALAFSPRRVLFLLLVTLTLGTWAFGKSFAYLGMFPIYISEVALVFGLLLTLGSGKLHILRHPTFILWLLLFGSCLVQAASSVMTLGQPPVEVLRNFSVMYYSLYAYLAYAAIRSVSQWQDPFLAAYHLLPRYALPVLAIISVSLVFIMYMPGVLPVFPGTTYVTVLYYKPTDASLPLAVLIGFWFLRRIPLYQGVWAILLMMVSAARNRSAMLTFAVALLFLWRPNRRGLAMAAVLLILGAVLVIGDFRISLGGYRELSASQFVENVTSLFGSEDSWGSSTTTAVTKSWREAWWEAILKDAQENSRYVIGTGWGSNLADMYGFQTAGSQSDLNSLRHPHNALLGILARAGWVVAGLWCLFYISLLIGLAGVMRRPGLPRHLKQLATLCVIYTLGCLINGSTDVFLESPQNAVPHWIVVGFGWALIAYARKGVTYFVQEQHATSF